MYETHSRVLVLNVHRRRFSLSAVALRLSMSMIEETSLLIRSGCHVVIIFSHDSVVFERINRNELQHLPQLPQDVLGSLS